MRVNGEPALVMQVKPYRETSAIVQFFSQHEGRVAAVLRGARRKRNPWPGLQPFNEVTINFSGRGGLMTLHGAELVRARNLTGNYLAGGFYVLELIARLMREHDPHPRLFAVTGAVLDRLCAPNALAPLLRVFERRLLEELGFGIHFDRDVQGQPIAPDQLYALADGEAFMAVDRSDNAYPGATLLAIADDDYSEKSAGVCARQIFRDALAAHLGPRPLASRALLKVAH